MTKNTSSSQDRSGVLSRELWVQKIFAMGQEMSACTESCAGIHKSPDAPPRGLLLETEGRATGPGVIVVGQNPGLVQKQERQHYVAHGSAYEQQVMAWSTYIRDIPYFTRLRKLLDHLGLNGPILWTDVAKCESRKRPPSETFARCSQKFLARELQWVPADWPVIAAGSPAFQALGYMAGERAVVGLAHPTGNFAGNRFQAQLERLAAHPDYRAGIRQSLQTSASRLWLE